MSRKESNWLSEAYSDIFWTVFCWGAGAVLALGVVGYGIYLLTGGGKG